MLLKQYKKHFFNSLKDIQDEQEIESFFFHLNRIFASFYASRGSFATKF